MKLFRISKLFSLLFAVRRYITCTLLTRSPLNIRRYSLSVYTDFKLLILSCPAHKLLCIPNIFPPSLEEEKISNNSFPLFNF